MSQVDEKTVNDTEIVSNASSNQEGNATDFNAENDNFENDDFESDNDISNQNDQDDQDDQDDYDEDEDEKADAAIQKTNANKTSERKVDLDLDGAPFLEEEKEEEPEPKEEEKKEDEEKEGKKKKFQLKLSKKKIIILAAIVLILIGAAVAAVLLLGGGDSTSENIEENIEEIEEEVEEESVPEGPNMDLEPFVVIVEEFKEPQGPPVYTEELDPFWIEMKDDNNETIFLVCNFALVTEDENFFREIQANVPEIRDTIYYYLAARDYKLLTNHENFPLIKEGMLTLVNRLLKKDQLTDVLYNSYITK